MVFGAPYTTRLTSEGRLEATHNPTTLHNPYISLLYNFCTLPKAPYIPGSLTKGPQRALQKRTMNMTASQVLVMQSLRRSDLLRPGARVGFFEECLLGHIGKIEDTRAIRIDIAYSSHCRLKRVPWLLVAIGSFDQTSEDGCARAWGPLSLEMNSTPSRH